MKSYLEQRRELKLKGPKPKSEVREERKAKGAFFANQIKLSTGICENCGKSLAGTMAINASIIVAHILPKKQFPSVSTNPDNRLYLCGDCHNILDHGKTSEIQNMFVFPIAVLRLKTFVSEIKESRALPKCFNTFVKKHDNQKSSKRT